MRTAALFFQQFLGALTCVLSFAVIGAVFVIGFVGGGCAPSGACASQNECPSAQVCSRDGMCIVPRAPQQQPRTAPAQPPWNGGAGGGGGGGAVADNGPAILLALTGSMHGTVGPITVDVEDASVGIDGVGATISVIGGGSPTQGTGALFVLSYDQGAITSLLTSPGVHSFGANALGSTWGQACTQNEPIDVSHYDEAVDTEVTVAAPDKSGNLAVTIYQHSNSTDVHASFTVPALD